MKAFPAWVVWLLAGVGWMGMDSGPARGADVRGYSLLKGHFLIQAEPDVAETDPDFAYSVLASVDLADFDLVTNATLRLPNGTVQPMDNLADAWSFLDTRNTFNALNSAYGWGNYTVTFHAINDGTFSCVLNLPNTALPPAPRLTNFDDVQAVNSTQPLTLQWDFASAPNASDFVQVYVLDGHAEVYSTPDLGAPGALNGLARSVTIPARTFDPGSFLSLNIEITRVVSTNSTAYPWAQGITGTFRSTEIYLTTIFLPRMRFLPPTNGLAVIEVRNDAAGRTNILQSSEDFIQWRNEATNVAPSGKSVFNVPIGGSGSRFFRAWQR